MSSFPLCRLPPMFKSKLQPTNQTMSGVGGRAEIAGEIRCDVKLAGPKSIPFRDIRFLVTTGNNPILIGYDVLGHSSSHKISFKKGGVTFYRQNNRVETAKKCTESELESHFQSEASCFINDGVVNSTINVPIQGVVEPAEAGVAKSDKLERSPKAESVGTEESQVTKSVGAERSPVSECPLDSVHSKKSMTGSKVVSKVVNSLENNKLSDRHKALEEVQAFNCMRPSPNAKLDVKRGWLNKIYNVSLPSDFNDHEVGVICDILIEHSDVLGSEDGEFGTYVEEVRLPTDGTSKSRPQFPISPYLKKAFDEEIEKMIKDGVLIDCPDPKGFNSPIFPVKKKCGKKVRVVVDYAQTLNKCLVDHDPWPIISGDEIISKIGKGNRFFADIDLRKGYWQIPIAPEDQHKTAVMHNNRCMMYTRLPMGVTSSGQIFSRCIAKTLSKMPSKENIASYLDDNLLYAKDFKTFSTTLTTFLKCLRKGGLKINGEKSHFLRKSTVFLGRSITAEGYSVVDEYVTAIKNMKPPSTKKEAQSFVGKCVWIRQFLDVRLNEKLRTNAFSLLMKPIIETINSKASKYVWTKDAELAFKKLKVRLTKPPVMDFADFSLPFALQTDASDVAAGAVVFQEHGGQKRIIAAVSRSFNKTEQRWSTTEREAYALKWAIMKFDLFFRHKPFTVFSDHKSLIYMDRRSFANQKIARWQEQLKLYRFCVQFIKGVENGFADMLSRPNGVNKESPVEDTTIAGEFCKVGSTDMIVYIPSWVKKDANVENLVLHPYKIDAYKQATKSFLCFTQSPLNIDKVTEHVSVATEQQKDNLLAKIMECLDAKEDLKKCLSDEKDERSLRYKQHTARLHLHPGTGILVIRTDKDKDRLVVPLHLRKEYLRKAHDECNHSGQNRTAENLRKYWWEGIDNDIKDYCKGCLPCARRKGRYGLRTTWNGGHCLRGEKPFECVYLDFIQLPPCRGKKYCLTMICSYSKYIMVFPSANARAIDATNGLLKLFDRHRVIPKIISSDQGSHFKNKLIEEFCKRMNIQQNLHTAYHPESCGILERAHRTLKNAIFILTNQKNCGWTEILDSVVSNMNACINKATGVSPHYLVTGREPEFGYPLQIDTQSTSSTVEYAKSVTDKLTEVMKAVKVANLAADEKYDAKLRKWHEQDPVDIDDDVLIYRPQSVEAKRTNLNWIGPFRVLKTNNMVVQILKDGDPEWIHMAHVRKVVKQSSDDDMFPIVPQPEVTESSPLVEEENDTASPSGEQEGRAVDSVIVSNKAPGKPQASKIPVRKTRSGRTIKPPNRLIQEMVAGTKTYHSKDETNNLDSDLLMIMETLIPPSFFRREAEPTIHQDQADSEFEPDSLEEDESTLLVTEKCSKKEVKKEEYKNEELPKVEALEESMDYLSAADITLEDQESENDVQSSPENEE